MTGPPFSKRQQRNLRVGMPASFVASTLELFPATLTVAAECALCGVIRPAGAHRPDRCGWETDNPGWLSWPPGCLAKPDPTTTPIPF